MRIAVYCPMKPLFQGNPSGDRATARGLVSGLSALGHEVREVSGFRARWFYRNPEGVLRALGAVPAGLLRTAAFRPDLFLAFHSYYKAPDLIGPLARRLLGIPYAIFQPMFATKYRKRPETLPGFLLNRAALKACDLAVTNNRNDLAALARIIAPGRVAYLPPAVDTGLFTRNEAAGRAVRMAHGIPDGAPLLFTAAMFRDDVKSESLAYLFRALARLRGLGTGFRLLVAGDGPTRQALEGLAGGLLPGRVAFAGRVAREAMPAHYSAADLFVFPGIGESLGMVYLEAQACGLPVAALSTAGIPQVVEDGVAGLLAPHDPDGAGLSGAVSRLLADAPLRRAMGEAASRTVRARNDLLAVSSSLSHLLSRLSGGVP